MSRNALLRLLLGAADRHDREAAEETFWSAVAGEPIRPEKLDPDLEVMARQLVRLGEAPLPLVSPARKHSGALDSSHASAAGAPSRPKARCTLCTSRSCPVIAGPELT